MSHGRVTVGHPVDVGSGAVFTLSTDFRIPGAMVMGWRRHYSTVATSDTWLGPKWTVPYFMRLERRADRYVLSGAHGEEVDFDAPTGPIRVGAKLAHLGANMELHRRPNQYRVRHWHAGGHVSWFCFNTRDDERMPLAAIENLSGHRIRLDYDNAGRPIRIVQELEGRTLEIAYDDRNLIGAVYFVTEAGRKLQVRYEYDAKRRLVAAVDALGHGKAYQYDDENRLTVEGNPLGSRFLFEYDRQGRCTRSAGADGFMERKLQYFATPRKTRVTDSRSSVTEYYLNPAGQVVQIVDPVGGVTTKTFDEEGRLAGVTHPDGAKESFAYDEQGNRASATDACGATTTTQHNDQHLPVRMVDRNGHAWGLANRTEGSLLGVEDLPPRVWDYTRDARNLVVRAESPGGWVIHVRHDQRFRWHETSDDISLLTRTEFDEFGYSTLARDAAGVVTRTRYDELHRKVEVARGSQVTRYRWNAVGRITERIGPGEQHDVLDYDQYGQLRAKTNALGETIRFEYDKEGNFMAIINRAGERLEYQRDAAGRIVEEKLFDGRIQRYEYNVAGRRTKIHLSDGRTISQGFDKAGRVVLRESSDGLTEEFEYDKEGREIKASNKYATVELKRDRFGNILEEIQNGRRLEYWYDMDNNRTRCLVPLRTTGGRLRRLFDVRGRLLTIGDERAWQQFFHWNNVDRLMERRSPGRLIELFTYDDEGRLHQHEIQARSQRIVRTHRHDSSGNLAALEDNQAESFRYSYDRLDRIKEVRRDRDDSVLEAYGYDANDGLRTTHRGPRRLAAGSKVVQDGPRELSYGADGSVRAIRTGSSTQSLKHDVNGRLVEVIEADGTVIRYEYDPFGRRTAKMIGQDRTEYLWEVWELVGELRKGKLQRIFVAAGLRPLGQWEDGRLFTPILDHRNAVQEVFDDLGEPRWACALDAYGNLISERGDIPSPFRLRGQYHDTETGLYYNYSRHYDPGLGDYTAPDPIGIEAGYNLYSYPRNPLRWHDPYGLECDVPANHPPEDDPKTSTRPPPAPVPPITGAPQPERDDVQGGKHAPDRTTAEVGALATSPEKVFDAASGKYVPATEGPGGTRVPAQPGDPLIYTPQGQWNSVDAAQRAAAQHDPNGPRVQTVPIGPNDGTVTTAAKTYPPPPGAPTTTAQGPEGPVQVQSKPTPERAPTDQAVTVRNPDGSIHTYPIDASNPAYVPGGSQPNPPPGGAPPAGGGAPPP